MNPLILPQPIAAYFAADRQSPEALARCFTANAVLKDEGQIYTGLHAISAWKAAASDAYAYSVEPFALSQDGSTHVVSSRVTGNFPGSPVDLRHHFRIEGGLIADLEIKA